MIRLAALVFFTMLVTACSQAPRYSGPAADGGKARGSVEGVEHLKGYSALELRGLILLARLPEALPVDHGVEIYRVRYWTQHLQEPVLASGLFALPRGATPRATVTWLHGTNTNRSDAVSTPSTEGVLVSAAFAGAGFLLIAPDYVGQGLTDHHHPYLYTPTTVSAAVDLLRAAQTVCTGLGIVCGRQLYLAGFSQGGHATAAVHRALEQHPEPAYELRAAAALSPPLDLANISVPFALFGASTASSTYLAWMADSYSRVYGQPLNSVLTDEWAASVPKIFDRKEETEPASALLPRYPRDMFRPEFLRDYDAGKDSWFRQAQLDNQVFEWAPKVPLRVYLGYSDVDVTPRASLEPALAMKSRGGIVEVLSIGAKADHGEVVYRGVPRVREWFLTMVTSGANTSAAGSPP